MPASIKHETKRTGTTTFIKCKLIFMRKEILRIAVGLDIGKDSIYVCIKYQDVVTHVSIKGTRKFSNTPKGIEALVKYLQKKLLANVDYLIVLEATGVYYENVAYRLADLGYNLTVVLPKRSAYFAKSDNQKTKNDKEDSKMLAQMGIEKFGTLKHWTPPSSHMRELRQLVRYRSQLVKHRSQFKQQLHALNHSYEPFSTVLEGQNAHVEYLDKQIKEIEQSIEACVKKDEDMFERLTNVCTIKGISLITAASVIAETYGFALFSSIPQLVSYAGYDVVENQSGNRVGKTKISKKGNSRIRAALHLPALSAKKNEPNIKSFYERIYKRNPKIKMIGCVAVQRKLLVLIYTLYRKNVSYDPHYEHQKNQSAKNQSRQSANPAYAA